MRGGQRRFGGDSDGAGKTLADYLGTQELNIGELARVGDDGEELDESDLEFEDLDEDGEPHTDEQPAATQIAPLEEIIAAGAHRPDRSSDARRSPLRWSGCICRTGRRTWSSELESRDTRAKSHARRDMDGRSLHGHPLRFLPIIATMAAGCRDQSIKRPFTAAFSNVVATNADTSPISESARGSTDGPVWSFFAETFIGNDLDSKVRLFDIAFAGTAATATATIMAPCDLTVAPCVHAWYVEGTDENTFASCWRATRGTVAATLVAKEDGQFDAVVNVALTGLSFAPVSRSECGYDLVGPNRATGGFTLDGVATNVCLEDWNIATYHECR